MTLSVMADQQRRLDARQFGEQVIEPKLRAFAPWRQVARIALARIAVAHRDDRHQRFVVERAAIDIHPLPQSFAARVVPRNAGHVHASAGGLSDDQNACRRVRAYYGTHAERKVTLAGSTIAHRAKERVERRPFWRSGML